MLSLPDERFYRGEAGVPTVFQPLAVLPVAGVGQGQGLVTSLFCAPKFIPQVLLQDGLTLLELLIGLLDRLVTICRQRGHRFLFLAVDLIERGILLGLNLRPCLLIGALGRGKLGLFPVVQGLGRLL